MLSEGTLIVCWQASHPIWENLALYTAKKTWFLGTWTLFTTLDGNVHLAQQPGVQLPIYLRYRIIKLDFVHNTFWGNVWVNMWTSSGDPKRMWDDQVNWECAVPTVLDHQHCQRHNGPMGGHHNWRYLIASKFSQQVAPRRHMHLLQIQPPEGATCISLEFGR